MRLSERVAMRLSEYGLYDSCPKLRLTRAKDMVEQMASTRLDMV